MSIKNLIKAIPPPVEPTYAFDASWLHIEGGTGPLLPFDYKELIRLYGAGRFLGFFDICGPWSPTPEGRFDNIRTRARTDFVYAVQGSMIFDDPPLPIWPRPGGLMAFGETLSGGYLFWLTRGLVDEWPIVIWDWTHNELESFECDLTDFLAGVANGSIRSEKFPDTWRPDPTAGFAVASPPWPGHPDK